MVKVITAYTSKREVVDVDHVVSKVVAFGADPALKVEIINPYAKIERQKILQFPDAKQVDELATLARIWMNNHSGPLKRIEVELPTTSQDFQKGDIVELDGNQYVVHDVDKGLFHTRLSLNASEPTLGKILGQKMNVLELNGVVEKGAMNYIHLGPWWDHCAVTSNPTQGFTTIDVMKEVGIFSTVKDATFQFEVPQGNIAKAELQVDTTFAPDTDLTGITGDAFDVRMNWSSVGKLGKFGGTLDITKVLGTGFNELEIVALQVDAVVKVRIKIWEFLTGVFE